VNTPEPVERAMGLALTPAFLLPATMMALNALTSRLTRILDAMSDAAGPAEQSGLSAHPRLARRGVQFFAVCAFLVAWQIAFTFIGALLGLRDGGWVAAVLILGMAAFMLTLVVETAMAECGPR